MKINIIFTRQFLLIAFILICSQHDIYSQESDSVRVKGPGLFVGFSFGPSQTQITNEGTYSGSELQSTKQTSFSGSAEVGYYFTKYFGLSSGIGFNSYKSQFALKAYQNNYSAIDSENESYEHRVTGTNINEEQKIGLLSVPIYLNIHLPLSKAMGFFFQTGVDLAIPLSKKYTSSGIFTYKGYYPATNALLENLPAYGFPTNYSTVANGDLELNSLNVSVVASAGFDYLIQKNIQIGVAASYSKSLSNISAYTSPETFHLSSEVDQINSFMGGSSKASLQSIGVKFSLRYYLKSR